MYRELNSMGSVGFSGFLKREDIKEVIEVV